MKIEFTGKPVIAIVGAGSLVWGRSIVVDLLLNPDLAGAEIRLLDINPERLALVHEWLGFAQQAMAVSHPISTHTCLEEGLRGVTACLTAISVGGDRLWRYDSTHPQLDGIFQPVGDTTGPGGAVRALRHAAPLKKVATVLAKVGAPNALLIQLTNPLNPLTSCLDHIPGIQVVGFCHGYDDTEFIIAKSLGLLEGVPQSCRWREKCPPIQTQLAGNNHFVFVDQLRIGEKIYDQKGLGELVPDIFDCTFREAVWSRYGVLAGNYPRHPIEFLPDFVTRKWNYGLAWGVPPVASEIDPAHGDRHADREPILRADLDAARKDFSSTSTWPLRHSHEPLDQIIAAFHTGGRFDVHLNIRNRGAVHGVSADHHLEMFCRIENGVIHRPKVRFPDRITEEIERIGKSQQLLARCCDSFEEDLLVEALSLDALMPKNPALIRSLMREMVQFQKHYLGHSE